MRPVSRVEPPAVAANFDNSDPASLDSARKAEASATDMDRGGDGNRQAPGDDGNDNSNDNTRKADGV
jgi:hypothetical protein